MDTLPILGAIALSPGQLAAEMMAREDERRENEQLAEHVQRQADLFEKEAVSLATVLIELHGGQPQIPETGHYFGGGLYMREMRAAPGIVVGRRHKGEFWNIVLAGKAVVVLNGQETTCRAGDKILSRPGVRKVARVFEELVWLAIHPNPNNYGIEDLAKLEAEIFDLAADEVVYPDELERMRQSFGVSAPALPAGEGVQP